MSTLLEETRRSFGAAPRTVGVRDNLTPPSWMKPNDRLRETYGKLAHLLANGDVIWGHVVQANAVLFRRGDEVAPAQVVYGSQADEDLPLERLRRGAHTAVALKGRPLADPALDRIAKALAAENERHAPLDLPNAITHGSSMRMAIVVVHRVTLPSGFLSTSYLPLLANRGRDVVAVFPCRYWSEDLKGAWLGLGAVAP